MKCLQLLLAIFALFEFGFVAGDFKVHNMIDVAKGQNACFEELDPPEDIKVQFLNLKFPSHESTACYVKCLLEKLDFFDNKQGFLTENIIAQMTHKNATLLEPTKLAIDKCINLAADTDVCARALQGFKCFMKDNSDAVIMSFAIKKKKK